MVEVGSCVLALTAGRRRTLSVFLGCAVGDICKSPLWVMQMPHANWGKEGGQSSLIWERGGAIHPQYSWTPLSTSFSMSALLAVRSHPICSRYISRANRFFTSSFLNAARHN